MRREHLAKSGLICTDPARPGAPSVAWCEDRSDCNRTRSPVVLRRIAANKASQAAQKRAGRANEHKELP